MDFAEGALAYVVSRSMTAMEPVKSLREARKTALAQPVTPPPIITTSNMLVITWNSGRVGAAPPDGILVRSPLQRGRLVSARRPQHKNEFDSIYNLTDPAPYFQALEPADYRMPWVLATWLKRSHTILAESLGDETLRLVDFACGYGTNGALLRHEMSMQALYSYFSARSWQVTEEKKYWREDRIHFSALPGAQSRFQITGIDVAQNALDYAQYLGFIDQQFSDDLIGGLPGQVLSESLAETHIVVESGAISPRLTSVCEHILSCARPWFIHCPRPDVDWRALQDFWRDVGYETFALNEEPIRYRKALSEAERVEIHQLASALGVPEQRQFRDDYLCVDLKLALPVASLTPAVCFALRRACAGLY